MGYPGYLTQILLNLINNAQAHAYPEGSPGSVQINLTTKMERYIIEVKDFGCGISEENLDQVFEAFYTTKRRLMTSEETPCNASRRPLLNGSILDSCFDTKKKHFVAIK